MMADRRALAANTDGITIFNQRSPASGGRRPSQQRAADDHPQQADANHLTIETMLAAMDALVNMLDNRCFASHQFTENCSEIFAVPYQCFRTARKVGNVHAASGAGRSLFSIVA